MDSNISQLVHSQTTLIGEATQASSNNLQLGPPPPVPLHTKPVCQLALYVPCDGEAVETAWIEALRRSRGSTPSEEEYYSAEDASSETNESPEQSPPFAQRPATPEPGYESDGDTYWSNVPEFNFESADVLTAVSRTGDTATSQSVSEGIGSSRPPTPDSPSTLFHAGTSNSVAAHHTSIGEMDKYYVVTEGYRPGVYDNWPMAKAAAGNDGTLQGFKTLRKAWEVFDKCREAGIVKVLS